MRRYYDINFGPGPGVQFTSSNDPASVQRGRQTERPAVESPHDREARIFQGRLQDRERARQ